VDDERLREVYAVAYPRLVGQLAGVTGDPAEAEDVVMEAFARAAPRRSSFHDADNPEAWLRTVAVNVARSRWRRMLRWAHLLPELVTPASYADLPEDRLALLAALRQLPTAQREAIALHHLADLPVAEVAFTLGVPEGTVKARLARGRAALATLLADTDSRPSKEDDHVA
jgi:RNA polymerase sigma-70 factor (ECF subfamily)